MQQAVRDQQNAGPTGPLPVMYPAADGHQDARRHGPGMLVAGRAGPARPGPVRQGRRQIVIFPAHGGAGASTLVTWMRRELGGAPAGHGWRVDDTPALPDANPERVAASDWLRVPPPDIPLIIAARGNAQGARRAVIAVATLEHRGIRPVAIALVADGAGPEPRQAAQHLDLIEGRAGPVIRIPFAAALRAGALPGDVRMRRGLHDAITGLLALAVPAPGQARQPW